jgi:hypothetical protein
MNSQFAELVGKTYKFEDGDSITVFQIKERDGNELFVTYHVQKGPGIPQKLLLPMHEFLDHYGHLFGITIDNFEGDDR